MWMNPLIRPNAILFIPVLLWATSLVHAVTLPVPTDWVPYHALTLDQKASVAPYCAGRFIAPPWNTHVAKTDDTAQPMALHATTLQYSQTQPWHASGQVTLSYQDLLLGADSMRFNPNLQQGSLSTDVQFRLPGLLIEGSQANVDLQKGTARFFNAGYLLQETGFSGQASQIDTDNEGYSLQQATMTPCDPFDPDWYVKSASLRIDSAKGIAIAHHARLNIGPVPIFYTPYLSFPIDDKRHTGFLSPSISFGGLSLNGQGEHIYLDSLSLPFYWNIAPHSDNTFTPTFQQEHDWYFDNETRYLTPNSSGVLELGWNPSEMRWLTQWQHEQELTQDTTLTLDWNDYSDSSVKADFKEADALTPYARQGLDLSKSVLDSDLVFTVERWKRVDLVAPAANKPYARQPGLNLKGSTEILSDSVITWNMDVSQFDKNLSAAQKSTLNPANGDTTNGWREALSLTGSRSSVTGPIQINPGARLDTAVYQLTDPGNGRLPTPSWIQPTVWVNLGSDIETPLGDSSWSQKWTPRLQWVYSPYTDQYQAPIFDTAMDTFGESQLFSTNRYSGMDRAGDMNRLSVSIAERLIRSDTGAELRGSIAQMIRLAPERTGLRSDVDISSQPNVTPIFTKMTWMPSAVFSMAMAFDWNTLEDRADQQSISVELNPNSRQRLFAQRTRSWAGNTPQDDLLVSGFTPIAQRWGLAASIDYNLTAEQPQNSLIGIEYDSCCWNIRVLDKINWLSEADGSVKNALFVEFTLKGLGQNNSQVESLLSEHINGYNGRLYR